MNQTDVQTEGFDLTARWVIWLKALILVNGICRDRKGVRYMVADHLVDRFLVESGHDYPDCQNEEENESASMASGFEPPEEKCHARKNEARHRPGSRTHSRIKPLSVKVDPNRGQAIHHQKNGKNPSKFNVEQHKITCRTIC